MPTTPPRSPSPTSPAAPPGARPARRRAARPLLLVLLLAVLALPGCGAADSASEPSRWAPEPGIGTDAGGAEGHRAGPDEADGAVEGEAGGAAGAGVGDVAAGPADRRIRRVDVSLEVDDLAAGAAGVRRVAADHDGYVATEASHLDAGSAPGHERPAVAVEDVGASTPWPPPGQAVLVLRVPQPRLDDAVAALATVGSELGRRTSEEVVEADLRDLDARVASAARSLARLRDLVTEAASLEEVLALEVEVSRREADLEGLRARRDALAGQAASATLSVSLLTPAATAAAGGFTGGLAAGWEALVAAAAVALTAVGAVLPFAAVAGVVAVPLLVLARRRRSARLAAG